MAGVLSIALHVGRTAFCGMSACFGASSIQSVLPAARSRDCAHPCRPLALVPARQSPLAGAAFGHGLRPVRPASTDPPDGPRSPGSGDGQGITARAR